MDALRRRIPFKFPEDEEPEGSRVLDEQEQEEVIESIRKVNHQSTKHYHKFLQGCVSFMIIFHIWFLVTPRQVTPAHILLPNARTPPAPLIPFATGFTLLNTVLLLNVILHLPKDLSFPRVMLSVISRATSHLPLPIQRTLKLCLPLPIEWITGLLSVSFFVSVLTLSDIHQIIWWVSPLSVVGVFLLVKSWIQESEDEVEKLEKLKYEAKGA